MTNYSVYFSSVWSPCLYSLMALISHNHFIHILLVRYLHTHLHTTIVQYDLFFVVHSPTAYPLIDTLLLGHKFQRSFEPSLSWSITAANFAWILLILNTYDGIPFKLWLFSNAQQLQNYAHEDGLMFLTFSSAIIGRIHNMLNIFSHDLSLPKSASMMMSSAACLCVVFEFVSNFFCFFRLAIMVTWVRNRDVFFALAKLPNFLGIGTVPS